MNCQETEFLCHRYEAYFLLWFCKLQDGSYKVSISSFAWSYYVRQTGQVFSIYIPCYCVTLIMGWLVTKWLNIPCYCTVPLVMGWLVTKWLNIPCYCNTSHGMTGDQVVKHSLLL